MRVPLRGVQFHGKWFCHECEVGDRLMLEREPDNHKGPNAVRVTHDGRRLGYVGREVAAKLAPKMDEGHRYVALLIGIWALEYTTTNGAIELLQDVDDAALERIREKMRQAYL